MICSTGIVDCFVPIHDGKALRSPTRKHATLSQASMIYYNLAPDKSLQKHFTFDSNRPPRSVHIDGFKMLLHPLYTLTAVVLYKCFSSLRNGDA